MDQQEPFKYQKLIGSGLFHLFLIQPCPDVSAPLEGKLVSTTLEEYDNSILDHYTALSYVWGDSKDKRMAFIDGKPLQITATLDSALRHVRHPKGELKMWADGICINQEDVEERNIQVQQMGLIYQLARHTIKIPWRVDTRINGSLRCHVILPILPGHSSLRVFVQHFTLIRQRAWQPYHWSRRTCATICGKYLSTTDLVYSYLGLAGAGAVSRSMGSNWTSTRQMGDIHKHPPI